MTTIKATKLINVNTLSEVLTAISVYGKENVNSDYIFELLRDSSHVSSNINTSEWQMLLQTANDNMIASVISELFFHDFLNLAFAEAFGVSQEEFVRHLVNIVLERKLKITRLAPCTSIEQLNALADNNLAPLYYADVVKSIDVDFVRKYANELDLQSIIRYNTNEEVSSIAYELNK